MRKRARKVNILSTKVGKIEKSTRGFAFLITNDNSADIFIAGRNLNGATHHDRVKVAVLSDNNGNFEGEVVEILSRENELVVGTFFANNKGGLVVPDEVKIAREIYVNPPYPRGLLNLDKVVVKVDYSCFRRTLNGKIVEILGQPDEAGVDIISIIRANKLNENFSKSVLLEAEQVSNIAAGKRVDFTNDFIFTIDGDDSKDFDDAISVEKLPNGNYKLGVHIADVSHYVRHNSLLDKEAYKRGTSVYFPEMVIPMLPEKLSNDICSLNEHLKRLTLSLLMEVDNSGAVVDYSLKEGVIESKARLTYSDVSKNLETHKLSKTLLVAKQLADILSAKRAKRGNIDFDIPESLIILDKDKKTVDVKKRERLVAHRIIEEFMLLANETVAKHLKTLKMSGIFRVHEPPPQEKFADFMDFLKALAVDFSFSDTPKPSEFAELLNAVKGKPYESAVTKIALRTMSKAEYSEQDKGHFGLASENYCHFTSPIRRYPDLVVHRIIKRLINLGKFTIEEKQKLKDFCIEAAKQSSEKERLAEKAEREVDELKKAEFMSTRIGERFSGVVNSCLDFGVFVELDNTCEGLVRVYDLEGDGYIFNPRTHSLENKVNKYTIGDRLEVVVASVSGSKIDFKLYGNGRG